MPLVSEKAADYLSESPARHGRMFRNGANQAVGIPKEFESPGKEAEMRQVGNRLVITPIDTSPLTLREWLDTNILSKVIQRPGGPLGMRLREVSDAHPGALVTGIINECELCFGAARVNSATLPGKIFKLLQLIPAQPLTADVVSRYAAIRTHLEPAGTSIGPNDTLIVAHAPAIGASLVSGGTEIACMPGLLVENGLAEDLPIENPKL